MTLSVLDIPGVDLHRRGKGASGRRQGLGDLGRNIYLSIGHNTKFRRFQKTYRDDRVAFVYDCMPKLRDTFALYQEEILANFDVGVRRQAVRSPHGAGKTLIAALIVHHTLLTTEEDAMVPTLASVWRQLEKFLWPEIHKVAKLLNWHHIGRDPYSRDELMVHSIRTNGGISEAFAVSSSDATAIEGAHASRLFYIFDESKSVEEPMWDSAEGAFATEGAVLLTGDGAGECYWLSISTPGPPSGRFYEIHSHKEGYDDWLVRHITLDEAIAAGRIMEDWVTRRAKQWGVNTAVFKNRVLGEFATSSADSVIPLAWIEAAMDRWREWDEGGRLGEGLGPRIVGVDTARFGDDKSVFAERIGDRIENLYIYAKQSVPVTAGFLKPLAKKSHEVRIEMDSGLGASVFDILDAEDDPSNPSMNFTPITMMSGTTAMDKTNTFRFNSIRSASWWHMREILDPDSEHEIALYPSDILLGDLAAPGYEIKYIYGYLTICVEKKDLIRQKNRLGRSTDEGDAVVVSFWDDPGGGGGVIF